MRNPTSVMPATTGVRSAPPPDAPPRASPLPTTYSYPAPPSSYPAAAGTPATAATWQSANPATGYAKVPAYPAGPTYPATQGYPAGQPYPVGPNPVPVAALPAEGDSPATKVSNLVTAFKEQGHALIAARRPFGEMFHSPAFSKPASMGDAINRIRRNVAYFRANYTITVAGILACSLFWHPGTLITLLVLAAAWFFLYFSKSGPLVLFGNTVDDGTVLGVLSAMTIVALLFTDMGWNVVGSVLLGVALCLAHATLRSTDDLFLTEEEAQSGALIASIAAAASASGPVLPTYVRRT